MGSAAFSVSSGTGLLGPGGSVAVGVVVGGRVGVGRGGGGLGSGSGSWDVEVKVYPVFVIALFFVVFGFVIVTFLGFFSGFFFGCRFCGVFFVSWCGYGVEAKPYAEGGCCGFCIFFNFF